MLAYKLCAPLFVLLLWSLQTEAYLIGVGISDITGPITDVNLMGYANVEQNGEGIHLRLFSRAFIIQESKETKPIAIVIIDAGMVSQIVKTKVVALLKQKYSNIFDFENVLISATHTHSGPGGYFQYVLYTFTSLGYIKNSFEALTEGITKSIDMAYNNRIEGKIFFNEGSLLNSSVNRSPLSYLMNPEEERNKYDSNVDTNMMLFKFVDSSNKPIGMINWFALHAVSMNNSNTLVSSDNKGLAAIMFEQHMNSNQLLGQGPFVAAFAQSNEGDVSPNLKGPKCVNTGLPCDQLHSSCNGKKLFDEAKLEITGSIDFIHQFVDMSKVSVTYKNFSGTTCKPAMGYSFAAGTTDGPGNFDFVQGMLKGSYFWDFIRNLLSKPSEQLSKCHNPKPILLATGEVKFPYQWQPEIVETQIMRIGFLYIVGLPGEFTTMSGRRIRNAVEEVSSQSNQSSQNIRVILSGLSNIYTGYVATPEEYQLQRYEGASTIYGPLTLPAYVENFRKLAVALYTNSKVDSGPKPPYYVDKLITFLPNILFDSQKIFYKFGDVLVQPNPVYNAINSTVTVVFVGASPRNNMRLDKTHLTVERFDQKNKKWEVKFTDANWETKFVWKRKNTIDWLFSGSEAIVSWTPSSKLTGEYCIGVYRIRYYGTSRSLDGTLYDFEGLSKEFEVKHPDNYGTFCTQLHNSCNRYVEK